MDFVLIIVAMGHVFLRTLRYCHLSFYLWPTNKKYESSACARNEGIAPLILTSALDGSGQNHGSNTPQPSMIMIIMMTSIIRGRYNMSPRPQHQETTLYCTHFGTVLRNTICRFNLRLFLLLSSRCVGYNIEGNKFPSAQLVVLYL